jgi:hypothetical protein
MEVAVEDFFYRLAVCLCGYGAIYVEFIFLSSRNVVTLIAISS